MEELSCAVQQYAWGKFGADSEVARFKASEDAGYSVRPDGTYAELWMGTHVNGPSMLKSASESLAAHLLRNPALVGLNPADYPDNDLAFLFKVLSIRTALSIQAHPDKTLARELHAKYPDVYKDANHKPEMAVALTPFEALCGFRPVSEIQAHLLAYPELAGVIGDETAESFRVARDDDAMSTKQEAVKRVFHAFMRCDDAACAEHLRALISRIQTSPTKSSLDSLMLRLHADFPGDRGALCPLLLNHLALSRGDCFFMGANEPHAYISGDCVECMALSDNVVRAGLTPKLKDTATLMDMLHFRCGAPQSFVQPVRIDAHTLLYRPPADVCAEFEVEMTSLPAHTSGYAPPQINAACIAIVTRGGGAATCGGRTVALTEGTVLFLPAAAPVLIDAGDRELEFFRAHVNLGEASILLSSHLAYVCR